MRAITLRKNQMYISTESNTSANTAIVLPMMISTTVRSTPSENSGSVIAKTVTRDSSPRRLDAELGDRHRDVDEIVRPDGVALRERHEAGSGGDRGVRAHRNFDGAARARGAPDVALGRDTDPSEVVGVHDEGGARRQRRQRGARRRDPTGVVE